MLVASSSLTASGVIAKREAFWLAMVEPSGSAEASSAAASAPLAPGLLITGNDAPSSSLSPLDTARLIRSLDPPGSAPTYISTVPEG